MKQNLKEMCKGTSRKEASTLLNITHMHAFVRNRKMRIWNIVEADDCHTCIGTRVVVHALGTYLSWNYQVIIQNKNTLISFLFIFFFKELAVKVFKQ